MTAPGDSIGTRPRDVILADIVAASARLIELRAELRVAEAAELHANRGPIQKAYEDGADLGDIRRDFNLTVGQLAGRARRGKWKRPQARVADLTAGQKTIYRDLREGLTKADAVRLAGEAFA